MATLKTPTFEKADRTNLQLLSRLSHHQQSPSYFVQGCFTQPDPAEKVGRVWIPFEPNENPNIGNKTHVRTKHNKLTEQIIRMIQDQIENTQKVFGIIRAYADRFSAVAGVGEEAMKGEREAHAVLALRLKGVEVCEWCEDAERWEVYFEDPDVKTGRYLSRPGWQREVAVGRRRDEGEGIGGLNLGTAG